MPLSGQWHLAALVVQVFHQLQFLQGHQEHQVDQLDLLVPYLPYLLVVLEDLQYLVRPVGLGDHVVQLFLEVL